MTILEESPPVRPRAFARLAGRAYRLRWWALVAWLALLAGVTAGSQAIGGDFRNDYTLPGTESQAALDALRGRGSDAANATVQIVLRHEAGLTDAAVRQRVEAMLADVRSQPHVSDVSDPYTDRSALSADGTIGYATVVLDGAVGDVPEGTVPDLVSVARAADGDGLQVELTGDGVREIQEGEGPPPEAVGLLAALVILVLMFGSLLAAGLPIVIAVIAVATSIGLIVLASHTTTVADYTPYIMMLVGLGVGIDYALLVFARYRSELLAGATRAEAAAIAVDTAGRTVLYAGCTVIIALLGLVLLGLGSLQGVAVAVAATVLVTMVASLTLLPALLAIVGPRLERSIRRRAAQRPGRDGARWRRWAAAVQRRPWLAALLPAVALLALAAPALDLRLGLADAGSDHPSTTSRRAYDLLTEGFGPGFNGPLVVVALGDGPAGETLPDVLAATPGVASAFPAGASGDVATVLVLPETAPQDVATAELVHRLREEVLPPLEHRTGQTLLVGGATAAAVDFSDAITARFLLFVGVVVGLSALLLLVVFRSLLIPLKAAVLNLLSIGASLGAVTLTFQHGWLGVQPGPVEAYVPIMIFAIAFGLSMDYEIFLLARMREAWQRRRDAPGAVTEGLATTGRVVTAAAAIMIVVFGAFMASQDRMLQQFGLGLAVAVFVDAVVIRCLILPAIMHLLGARAWWLPEGVARRLPRVALEE